MSARRWRLSPRANGPGSVLIGPYDEEFLEAFKAAVPSHAREWRPVAKAWRVSPEFVSAAQEVIDAFDPPSPIVEPEPPSLAAPLSAEETLAEVCTGFEDSDTLFALASETLATLGLDAALAVVRTLTEGDR